MIKPGPEQKKEEKYDKYKTKRVGCNFYIQFDKKIL